MKDYCYQADERVSKQPAGPLIIDLCSMYLSWFASIVLPNPFFGRGLFPRRQADSFDSLTLDLIACRLAGLRLPDCQIASRSMYQVRSLPLAIFAIRASTHPPIRSALFVA